MTCLSCEKCHSHDFEQLPPFYAKDGLKQVFKCKNCGKELYLNPMSSGITMNSLFPCITVGEMNEIDFSAFQLFSQQYFAETIKRLWKAIEDIEKKINEKKKEE
jgi:hypothetical protein